MQTPLDPETPNRSDDGGNDDDTSVGELDDVLNMLPDHSTDPSPSAGPHEPPYSHSRQQSADWGGTHPALLPVIGTQSSLSAADVALQLAPEQLASHRISDAGSDLSIMSREHSLGHSLAEPSRLSRASREGSVTHGQRLHSGESDARPSTRDSSSAEPALRQESVPFAPETLQVLQQVVDEKRRQQEALAALRANPEQGQSQLAAEARKGSASAGTAAGDRQDPALAAAEKALQDELKGLDMRESGAQDASQHAAQRDASPNLAALRTKARNASPTYEWGPGEPGQEDADDPSSDLYSRAVEWKKRSKHRYEEMRKEMDAEEQRACTFSPKINKSSINILRHSHRFSDYSDKPIPPLSAGPAQAKKRLEFDGEPEASADSSTAERPASADGTPEAAPVLDSEDSKREADARDKGVFAAHRLYARGMDMKAKQLEAARKLQDEEMEGFRAASPKVNRLSPAIYGPGAEKRVDVSRAESVSPARRRASTLLPSGMDECTFHPQTNARKRQSPAPKPGIVDLGTLEDLKVYSNLNSARGPHPHPHLGLAGSRTPSMVNGGSLVNGGGSGSPQSLSPRLNSTAAFPGEPPKSTNLANALAQLAELDGSAVGTDSKYSLAPQLDFDEFLDRQQKFLETKMGKIQAAVAEQRAPAHVRLSPGSKKILKQRNAASLASQQQAAAVGQLQPVQDPDVGFVERLEQELAVHSAVLEGTASYASYGRERQRELYDPYADMTFQPQITQRAHQRPPRSIEELSEGDRLRRHCYLEQMRLEKLLAEEAELTFKPKINPYPDVQPRLNLKHPDQYLAQVRAKYQSREEQCQENRRLQEERELEECTFSPKIKAMPAYIERMARSHAARHADEGYSSLYAQRSEEDRRALSWL
ncbi:hypothetical protein WJX72_000549 [[Myrmecia] bisecta]|uniref:Uncharacterized protein n=1 Tax=[Myrmecia] bisecta TaxID=41462 RepID=A0AAW1PKI4_9CHLO